MNTVIRIREPWKPRASTLSSVSPGNGWYSWITGRALPLCVWIFFVVATLYSMLVDTLRMLHEGASLNSLLLLARAGLTAAFMVLLATAYLTRMKAVEKARGFSERILPLLVFVGIIAGVGFLQSGEKSSTLYLAGAGLVVAQLGICLSIWSLWHLRGSFSILAEARLTVVSGPYRYLRHPLYLGEIMSMFGLCLLIGTGIALLFWGIITGLQLVRARIEERKLSRALSDYEGYRKKTPFIVPDFSQLLR